MFIGWVMHIASRTHGRKWSKDSFLPCHNSYRMAVTLLLGMRLRIYAAVSNASPQKLIGGLVCAIIGLTMLSNVQFLRSTTPFCYAVPRLFSCLLIPFYPQNSLNKLYRYS